jgi:hypothetical protein
MAEGDKFERKLRGKGWPIAYRLAKGGAPIKMVVDALITASTRGLNNELTCPKLSEVFNTLYRALVAQWQRRHLNLFPTSGPPPYEFLSSALERLEAEELGSVSTRLASSAALVVYTDLESSSQPLSSSQVMNCFSELFISRVVDNRWLSIVRDGIVAGTERVPAAQVEWENELFQTLSKQANSLISRMVKPDGTQAVARAPRRLTPRRKATKDLLHQPLRVIGGAK